MRRPFLALIAAVGFAALTSPGQAYAQIGGGGYDVFSFYYGYYLPHQSYIAAQPTPLDTINSITAQRQYAASTDRSALYDPISPYAEEEDPFSAYGSRGKERTARSYSKTGAFVGNAKGNGPGLYFNRAAQYYPTLKPGRGANQNLAHVRTGRGGFSAPYGGMGMPR